MTRITAKFRTGGLAMSVGAVDVPEEVGALIYRLAAYGPRSVFDEADPLAKALTKVLKGIKKSITEVQP